MVRQISLTAQISRHARSKKPARRHGQRAAEVDHARESAAVEDIEAILFIYLGSVPVFLYRRDRECVREVCWWRTYGVLFLDIELEVDGAGAGGCDAELRGGRGSLVIRVLQDEV